MEAVLGATMLDMTMGFVNSPGVCWVCGIESEDRHHIVPRAYGGEKGPTVDLCQTCHRNAHEAGEAGESPSDERLAFLAGCVREAKAAVKDDPNKSVMFSVRLSAADCRPVESDRQVFGIVPKEGSGAGLGQIARFCARCG